MKPIVCGVYLLFKDRSLVYIGKSKDIYNRVDSHRSNGREFDYAAVVALPDQDMDWVENSLISSFDSLKNRQKLVKVEKFFEPKSGHHHKTAEVDYNKIPPQIPQKIMSLASAVTYVKNFGFPYPAALATAVKNGEIPSVVVGKAGGKNGVRRKVLRKDIEAWCNSQLEKYGFSKEAGFQL